MQNLKITSSSEPIEGQKIISIGQLKLKRTVFVDPNIVRLYLDNRTYMRLCSLSIYAGSTVDELIRDLIIDFLKTQD